MLRDDVEKSVKSVQCRYACGGTSLVKPCLQQHWHDVSSLGLTIKMFVRVTREVRDVEKLESYLSSPL